MYRAIVKHKVRATWKKVSAGDLGAAVGLATDDLRFEFVGSTSISTQLHGRDGFERWFEATARRLPGLRFEVLDVVVNGWPWNTRVSSRIRVASEELPGGPYENVMVQWITLRWGRMTDDWVMEDTVALERVLAANQSGSV